MIDREYWGFNPYWLEYVTSTWEGRGRVELIRIETPASAEFRERAVRAFKERGIPCRIIKTYLSVQVPVDGEGYDANYPHTHSPENGTALVHYLQPGDVPAPLDILETEEGPVIETIYPEPGLTVLIPNSAWHGARKNHGATNRVQLIATTLR